MVQLQCSGCALSIAFRQRERTVCSGALPLMRFATAACCAADGQPAVRRSHSIAARWQPEANFHCLALLAGCHAAPVIIIYIYIAPYGRNFRGAGPDSVLVGVRRGKRVSLGEEKCL